MMVCPDAIVFTFSIDYDVVIGHIIYNIIIIWQCINSYIRDFYKVGVRTIYRDTFGICTTHSNQNDEYAVAIIDQFVPVDEVDDAYLYSRDRYTDIIRQYHINNVAVSFKSD